MCLTVTHFTTMNTLLRCSTAHSIYRDRQITPPTSESDIHLFTTFCTLNETLQVAQKRVGELREKHKQEEHKLEVLKDKYRKTKAVNTLLMKEQEKIPGGWLREKDYGL